MEYTLAIFAQDQSELLSPGCKRSNLLRTLAVGRDGRSVWDLPGVVLQEKIESVHKRAARFVTGSYTYETTSRDLLLMQHLEGVFFCESPRCETSSYKYYLIMI